MKRHLTIILSIILILSVLLCGCSKNADVKAAEKAVDDMFTAFVELDFETASKYIDISKSLDLDLTDGNLSEEYKKLMQAMFKNLSYDIVSSKAVDDKTVKVTVDITNTDMVPIIKEFSSSLMMYAYTSGIMDTEETTKTVIDILVDCLSADDLDTVTNQVEIVVENKDGNWQVKSSDTLTNALLGGFIEASKNN